MRNRKRTAGRILIGAGLALLAFAPGASAQTFTQFGVGTLGSPHGIAVDQQGDVYVADTDNSFVRKFDNAGGLLTTYGAGQTGGVNLEEVVGVAVGNQATNPDIFVATQGTQKVLRLDSNGNQLVDYGPFANPTSVEVDEANHVWVTDAGNDILVKFTLAGELLNVYGKPGGGPGSLPGEFNDPLDVATDAPGDTFVADNLNSRVQKLDPLGAPIWQITGLGVGQPAGVDVDLTNQVWVTDNTGNVFSERNPDGSIDGAPHGGTGSGLGQFNGPFGIAVDCALNVFVADTNNNRVQRFGTTDEPPCVAPFNTRSPELAGQPQVGSGLALDRGDWTGNPPPAFSYRWQRCTSASPETCGDIAGERELAYTITEADRGLRLRAVSIASNTEGTIAEATDMTPPIPTVPITPLPPVPPNPPPSPPSPNTSPPTVKRLGFARFQVNCPVTGRVRCEVRGDVIGGGAPGFATLAVAAGTVPYDDSRVFKLRATKRARRLVAQGYNESAIMRVVVDGQRRFTARMRFDRATLKRFGGKGKGKRK
jgi:streptogramin lyase